jgi:hypothetical protein
MRNGSYYSQSFENQYLESDHYDQEGDFEDLEMLYEDYEGDFEDLETMYEDGETWEASDPEGDQFLGGILKAAKPLLGGIVPNLAAQVGGRLAGRRGARLAHLIASNVLREAEAEGDMELDPEGDPEGDLEALGINPELLAEMAHYAQMAAETDNEAEADQFIGALAGLASQIVPALLGETDQESVYEGMYEEESDQFLPLVAAAAPLLGKVAAPLLGKAGGIAAKVGGQLLGRGIRTLGGLFRRKRRTRRLLPALAPIAMRSARQIASAARTAGASGRPVTAPMMARAVTGSLARSTAQTLATPARVQMAIARNRHAARRFRVSGTLTLRPARRRMVRR